MQTRPRIRAAHVAAAIALLLGARLATAQRALVYCPTDVDATGCARIVAALQKGGDFPGGVDRGYTGADGTIDLRVVQLSAYRVFVVPSLADDGDSHPYALLRDTAIAERLRTALRGRSAFYAGTPDQGTLTGTRSKKDALIRNLARWAAAPHSTARGPGLVVLQDHSTDAPSRYSWLRPIVGVSLTSDPTPRTYATLRFVTATGTEILSAQGVPLAYGNIASFGISVSADDNSGLQVDAVGSEVPGTASGVLLTSQGRGEASGSLSTTQSTGALWFSPLGTAAADPLNSDANANPVVELCDWTPESAPCSTAPLARFVLHPAANELPLSVDAAAGVYQASLDLSSTKFTVRHSYPIRVLQGTSVLGLVSVDIIRGRWAPTRIDGTLAPLVAATSLPIRFGVQGPASPRSVTLQFDPAVSSPTRASIRAFYSLVDSVPAGSGVPLQVPAIALTAMPLVAALDAHGEIILAASAQSTSTPVLGARSSALALVEGLIMGTPGTHLAPPQLDAVVVTDPAFQRLVSTIQALADAQTTYLGSSVVAGLALTIANDITGTSVTHVLVGNAVVSPPPYIPSFVGHSDVRISDSNGADASLLATNYTPAVFYSSVSAHGGPLGPHAMLAPMGASVASPGLTTLGGLNGIMDVTVGTDQQSAKQTVHQGFLGVASVLGSLFGAPFSVPVAGCMATLADTFIADPAFDSDRRRGGMWFAIRQQILYNPNFASALYVNCPTIKNLFPGYRQFLSKFSTVLNAVMALPQIFFLRQTLDQLNNLVDLPPETVSICQDSNVVEGCDINVILVAPAGALAPPGVAVQSGSQVQLSATALDLAATPMASRKFTWTLLWASDPGVIASVDPNTGLVTTGTVAGQAQIQAATMDWYGAPKTGIAFVDVSCTGSNCQSPCTGTNCPPPCSGTNCPPPCTGTNCPPLPCTGANCPPPPCTGANCPPPPCAGANCPPPPCTGANCPPPCTGANCQPPQPQPLPPPSCGGCGGGGGWGDPHMVTVDGLLYDFQGVGDFILVKSTVAGDDFEVQTRNQPWGATQAAVMTGLAARIMGDVVNLFPISGGAFDVVVNGAAQLGVSSLGRLLPGGGTLQVTPGTATLSWPNGTMLTAGWYNVRVFMPPTRRGNLEGLLGDFDGDYTNDLRVRNGPIVNASAVYGPYRQSWRVALGTPASLFASGPDPWNPAFPQTPPSLANLDPVAVSQARTICQNAGAVSQAVVDGCAFDVVLTGNNSFVAAAAAVDPAALRLTVAPALSYLTPNQSVTLTAIVTGMTNANVTWSATGGSITSTGANTATYTAPQALGTFTVTARSAQNGSVVSSATVIVSPIPPSITPASTITTFAGTGVQGSQGVGGPAVAAQLNGPGSLAVGPDGSLYISQSSPGVVRRVLPNGILNPAAGSGAQGCGPDGVPATSAALTWVHADAVAPDGTIYLADYGCGTLRVVRPNGIIATLAGVQGAGSLALGPDGSLYMTFNGQNKIGRIPPGGTLAIIAGTGAASSTGDGGPALQAALNGPHGIAVGPDGSLYITENQGNRIRRIAPNGIISTIGGTGASGYTGDGGQGTAATLRLPYGITVGPDGAVYFCDLGNNVVRRIGTDGVIGTVVGTGAAGSSGDGGASGQARLNVPAGLAFALDGALFISELSSHRVRRVK